MTVRLPRPLLYGSRCAVASAHPLAVSAGDRAFANGGSAADAAVATAAALGVVLPEACGIGGDALAVVQRPGETPLAYVGGAALPARPQPAAGLYGPASVGVPGALAALCALHREHGRLGLEEVLAPAIRLARDGFPVSDGLVAAVDRHRERLAGQLPGWPLLELRPGQRWRQPELAAALERVAQDGQSAFYHGELAAAIVRATAGADGTGISEADLAGYVVEAQDPVAGRYRGARLWVTGPPSQAVLALAALRRLESAPPAGTLAGEHAAIEAVKAAFEHRPRLARSGDAEAVLGAELPPTPVRATALSEPAGYEHTAAVATAQAGELVVSLLTSVFHEFGSGVLVAGGGFLLNNRLAGSPVPASPRAGWRPGHTLSPLLLEWTGRRIALATPGADGQVQTLVQLVRAVVDHGVELAAALAAPRWRSARGVLVVEASLDAELRRGLERLGHELVVLPDGELHFGAAAVAGELPSQAGVLAAADQRREVWAAVE